MICVVVVCYFLYFNFEFIEIFIGMVMLLGIVIIYDLCHCDENDIDVSGFLVFEECMLWIIKNLFYIVIVGVLIVVVVSMKIFVGSEVLIFILEKVYFVGVMLE